MTQDTTPTSDAADLPEALRPVEPVALIASIQELNAWEARADGELLTQAEGESIILVLHELKRLLALAAGQATAAQAVVQDDRITLRKPATRAETLWLLKLAHLVISDVGKTLEAPFAPAQPVAQQGVAYAALPDEGEPWRGHKFKEVQRGCWRCDCGKTIKEVTSDQSTPASGGNYPVMPKRYTVDDDGEELFTAEKMRAFADATCALRASRGQAPAETGNSVSAKGAAITSESGTTPAEQQATCTNSDSWNCKYCNKAKTCAALAHAGQPPAPTAAQVKACVCGEPQASGTVRRVYGPCYVAAPQQVAYHLAQALTGRENQPNQYGVEFGMSGTHMHFEIGNQLFKLAYEPDEQEDFDFMKRMLVKAFTTFTHDVKAAPPPSPAAQPASKEQPNDR